MRLSLISESVNCPACNNPTSAAELNSYNGTCEDCWASGIKTKTNSRSVQVIKTPIGSKEYGGASDDKGRDVLSNRDIFKSSENKSRLSDLLKKPKSRLAKLKEDLADARYELRCDRDSLKSFNPTFDDREDRENMEHAIQLGLQTVNEIQAEIDVVNREITRIKAETPTQSKSVGGI
jgi:uncharacterized small protein (DUF1192 family)